MEPIDVHETSSELDARIVEAVNAIRHYLQRDGGDLEFVRFEVDSHTCVVRMVGSCERCPLASLTLRAGVEQALIYAVPEIVRVERV